MVTLAAAAAAAITRSSSECCLSQVKFVFLISHHHILVLTAMFLCCLLPGFSSCCFNLCVFDHILYDTSCNSRRRHFPLHSAPCFKRLCTFKYSDYQCMKTFIPFETDQEFLKLYADIYYCLKILIRVGLHCNGSLFVVSYQKSIWGTSVP